MTDEVSEGDRAGQCVSGGAAVSGWGTGTTSSGGGAGSGGRAGVLGDMENLAMTSDYPASRVLDGVEQGDTSPIRYRGDRWGRPCSQCGG